MRVGELFKSIKKDSALWKQHFQKNFNGKNGIVINNGYRIFHKITKQMEKLQNRQET